MISWHISRQIEVIVNALIKSESSGVGLALFPRILNKSGSDTHGFVISFNFLVIRGLFSSCSAC